MGLVDHRAQAHHLQVPETGRELPFPTDQRHTGHAVLHQDQGRAAEGLIDPAALLSGTGLVPVPVRGPVDVGDKQVDVACDRRDGYPDGAILGDGVLCGLCGPCDHQRRCSCGRSRRRVEEFRMYVPAPLNSASAPVTSRLPRRARPGLLLGANLASSWRELEFWLWRPDPGPMEPGTSACLQSRGSARALLER